MPLTNAPQALRGAEHIVQLITCTENPLLHQTGSDWHPMTMILEHVEHGDLGQLMNRLRRAKQKLPVRMLWSLFLCCR